MTYVVTDVCVKCKYTDCVEVCPVDCFHEGEVMVVIDPEKCIDCGVCEIECPVEAIKPEAEELIKWIELGQKFSKKWPQILHKKAPLPQADLYKNETNKFEKYCISK
ncbi:4Fe-4S binding domain protein [Orientia chuto str. Dubai]|uniref:Ferredoxin n=1 Tax=Orientia chuto str. Dubai TaxID=1359168 RepID=A0A0F3MMY6_9RICK|nr:ferredoxin FdxA [Candidatus Orientia mediorientalis]KJV57080.1 4Fe-4S binding domain protein [Orientia chuto str. Dubai]